MGYSLNELNNRLPKLIVIMKTATEYILYKCGTKAFERAIQLNDIESIKDFMNDFSSHYANAKLDESAEKVEMTYHCGHTKNNIPTKYHQSGADNIQINKQSILSLKDKI